MIQTIRAVMGRLAVAAVVALASNPGAAADLAVGAYLRIPFGDGNPALGFGAGMDTGPTLQSDDVAAEAPRLGVELRYGAEGDPVFLVNGFPIRRSLILHASDEGTSGDAETDFDWRTLVGAALGVGLIVAIVASDNTTIKACSGPNCPPEEKPEEEPEPAGAGEGT